MLLLSRLTLAFRLTGLLSRTLGSLLLGSNVLLDQLDHLVNIADHTDTPVLFMTNRQDEPLLLEKILFARPILDCRVLQLLCLLA